MFLLVIECDKANASTKKSELAKSAMFAVGADAAMRAYKATSAEVKRKYVMCVRDIERKSGNDHAKHFAMSALAHTTALFSTYAELLTSSHPSKRHADFDLMTSFGGEEEPGTQSVGMSDSHTETDENNKKTNSIEEVYTHGLASIKEMKGKQENASVKTYFECIETIIKDSHDTWLRTPGAKGQKHNDSKMRFIKSEYRLKIKSAPDGWMDKYLEAWELITG